MVGQASAKRVLVANRGEIAARVIRAVQGLGWHAIAVHSEVDGDSPHVRMADSAAPIGPAQAHKSYTNIEAVLHAARETGAELVHPGYGFLSENGDFARAVERAGLTWVGPRPEVIERMGDKLEARNIAAAAGVPVLPGTHEPVAPEQAVELAREIGFPLMIKAVGGGGGIGIARVEDEAQLEKAVEGVQHRARTLFGNDRLYLERFLENPRHIEIQVFADHHGRRIHLGERECSIQRRNQKVVEEAPSPLADESMRQAMGEAALKLVDAVNYTNAGTVEFLADNDGNFYFMEMNTRIQVEHPVTELVTGTDLVAEQLRVALGEPLTLEPTPPAGHAIEVRLYAENPEKKLLPSPGTIERITLPVGEGIRVEHAMRDGIKITPFYDPMIAKIVTHGRDRATAIDRMREALGQTRVEGIRTNLPLLLQILEKDDFREGRLSTDFMREHFGIA